jgi:Flp pilus assembly pilin Flp
VSKLIASAKRFIASEDAPSMVEYGLLVGLIAVLVAVAHRILASSVSSLFNATANSV